MHRYGLIGFPLEHSFSQRYFTQKFEREGRVDCRYENFPLPDIAALPGLLARYPDLCGLNVTIPHKIAVVPHLHALDDTAQHVGAVNTIRIRDGLLTGFNTDIAGFERSILPWLQQQPPGTSALVLGTGGAARAVAYVLRQYGISFRFASRNPDGAEQVAYGDLPGLDWEKLRGIFNTTPLGTYPKTEECPALPFQQIGPQHLVYDLVYNPPETLLLQRAKSRGALIKNGLEMLHLQAEAAWEIWQPSSH